MEEILSIEISGKFNGRDATLSIDLDAESAFEIEDVEAGTPEESPDETEVEAAETEVEPEVEAEAETVAADAETTTQTPQTEPVSAPEQPAEPEVAPDDEPPEPVEEEAPGEDEAATGLDELFPHRQFDEEDLPPFSANTKQYKVAKAVEEAGDEMVRVREISDKLQEEEGEDEWNDSKVTSHLYSVKDKGIVDREKDEASGKWQYFLTDLGRAAIRHAERNTNAEAGEAEAAA